MYLFLWKRGCFLSRLDVCREMTGKCKLNLDIVVFASVVELENHIHYLTVTTSFFLKIVKKKLFS